MWRRGSFMDSDDSDEQRKESQSNDGSKVYFLLSPEWKAATPEGQKLFLTVFAGFYMLSLLIFCYVLVHDAHMVHTLHLKAFVNTRPETPLLQKVHMETKVR